MQSVYTISSAYFRSNILILACLISRIITAIPPIHYFGEQCDANIYAALELFCIMLILKSTTEKERGNAIWQKNHIDVLATYCVKEYQIYRYSELIPER